MTIYKVLVRDPNGTTRLVDKSASQAYANRIFQQVRIALLAARPESKPVFVTEDS